MQGRDPYKLYPHDAVLKSILLPLIPNFVKPNYLTILRIVLTPIVVFLLIQEQYTVGVPLFIITAFTDALDGTLARVRKQITSWGTFFDPIADKLLIGLVVIVIVTQHINLYFGLLIILLEALIVIGAIIRRKLFKHSISANMWGKAKMFAQFVGVSALLFAVWFGVDLFIPFSVGTLSLAIVLAVISLFTYSV